MENLQTIMDACLKVYGVDFTANNRVRRNVYARCAYYTLARKHTNLSLSKIGLICGKRDHSTVLHGIRTANSYELNKDYRKLYNEFARVVDGLLSIKEPTEVETYHEDLLSQIKTLENENTNLRIKIYEMNRIKSLEPKDAIQVRITKTIMELPDNILEDFEKYRLNPYLKLQKSKVIN
tara:strand:+ start:392 stop:928 length:537 start_codon:yes stop_codon:yes gene_type:complete